MRWEERIEIMFRRYVAKMSSERNCLRIGLSGFFLEGGAELILQDSTRLLFQSFNFPY